jgi:hypothetical protein
MVMAIIIADMIHMMVIVDTSVKLNVFIKTVGKAFSPKKREETNDEPKT